MTHPISDQAMHAAIKRLQTRIDELNSETEISDPQELEKLAKAITAYLKSISDIRCHNQKLAELERLEKYTAYEDFPPPSPEDRARFIARFQKLYARIALAQGHSGIMSPHDIPGSDALDTLLGGTGKRKSN